MKTRSALLALMMALGLPIAAAPPSTLTYQGTLGNAGGQPLSGSFDITFRLYDAQAGGVALWDESETVEVLKGRFAVQLGDTTPMPQTLFATPLYLGITVAGDVEMTPRLALSSTPYAMRAVSLQRNTIHVPADGTPQGNGAALRAAIAELVGASADNRYVIAIDAGSFLLGSETLTVPSHVELQGSGSGATVLSSSAAAAAVLLHSNTAVRALTVANSGAGGSFAAPTTALQLVADVDDVAIEHVVARSAPAGTTQGTDVRAALDYGQASNLTVSDSKLVAERSASLYGVRGMGTDVGSVPEPGIVFRDVAIQVSAASANARGVDVYGLQDIVADDVSITVASGGLATTNAIGVRTQPGIGLRARGLEVDMQFADSAPLQLMGIVFYGSGEVGVSDFDVRLTSADCAAGTGYRNGVVFRYEPGATALRYQQQPWMRDGAITVKSADCFASAVYVAGGQPVIDNVQLSALQTVAASQFAIAWQQVSSSDACDGAEVQDGTTLIRHSTIAASSAGGQSLAVDTCIDGFAIENSTLEGQYSALIVRDNSAGSFSISVDHSRLRSQTFPAIDIYADSSSRISHSLVDAGMQSPIRALLSPDTATRGTVSCLAMSTPASFTAGPICACTAGGDCPSSNP